MDTTDVRILAELQADARITMAELGRRVALSPPAVTERVRRLERAGIVEGYTAHTNLKALGYGLLAFVWLSLPTNTSARSPTFLATLRNRAEIIEAHHITGDDCFLLKVAVRDAEHLEELISDIGTHGRTTTSIVLSSPVVTRPLLPPDTRDGHPKAGRGGKSG